VTDETKAKVSCVLLALEYNQRKGKAPQRGDAALTPQYLADLSEVIGLYVSATTWREIEKGGLEKLRLHLLTTNVSAQAAINAALSYLNPKPQA
jgi:hypothetical protein